ncbi:hypothetical protein BT69DRAFT_1297099 [Atractiella rhizophila]|nr:hypothetical protein BT69DRAFT_1297099 [Atractiella rhizophila]
MYWKRFIQMLNPRQPLDKQITGSIIHTDPIIVSDGLEHHSVTGDNFANLMFPHPAHQADQHQPADRLLQGSGVVTLDKEMLFVVKNGDTFGCASSISSFPHHCKEYRIKELSMEIGILSYNSSSPFSMQGDSGSIILDGSGRIVSLLTGHNDQQTNMTDVVYATLYWWLEQHIKRVYPDCYLYNTAE